MTLLKALGKHNLWSRKAPPVCTPAGNRRSAYCLTALIFKVYILKFEASFQLRNVCIRVDHAPDHCWILCAVVLLNSWGFLGGCSSRPGAHGQCLGVEEPVVPSSASAEAAHKAVISRRSQYPDCFVPVKNIIPKPAEREC